MYWVIVITKGLTDFKGKTICVSNAFVCNYSGDKITCIGQGGIILWLRWSLCDLPDILPELRL